MKGLRGLTLLPVVAAALGFFVGPASAAEGAQQSEPSQRKTWDELLLVPRAHLGLGTPVGFLGVSGELNLIEYLALQLGVGTNGEGPQLAFMGYGRLPVGADVGLNLGAGVSEGAYVYRSNLIDADHSDDTRWDSAVFLDGEIGLETLSPGGFSMRASLGLARLLNPGSVSRCNSGGDPAPCTASRERVHMFPYFGVAMGYAFSL
jgi:hypothetical protein